MLVDRSIYWGVLANWAAPRWRANKQIGVNAATGNLAITRQDEMLFGRGPDLGILRFYNSIIDAGATDSDNFAQRQMGTRRWVYDLTGTLNTTDGYALTFT
ncbi:MAG: hypothetical protein RL481_1271, partial [Pseudomonadota bacterium]